MKEKGYFFKTKKGWRYSPSEAFKEMRANLEQKQKVVKTTEHLWGAVNKLKNLDKAFEVAHKSNRKVSHVHDGKIVLVAR